MRRKIPMVNVAVAITVPTIHRMSLVSRFAISVRTSAICVRCSARNSAICPQRRAAGRRRVCRTCPVSVTRASACMPTRSTATRETSWRRRGQRNLRNSTVVTVRRHPGHRHSSRRNDREARRGYCQVDEKLVARPPRYWARASREPAMLGIRNGRQPQLDNTRVRSVRRREPAADSRQAERARARTESRARSSAASACCFETDGN